MSNLEETSNQKLPRLGVRHLQAFLIFLCFIINFLSRLNVSFAIVAMTNAESTNPDFPEYDWNEKQISYILSSANLGVLLSMVPGSFMCRKLGVKITMMVSTLGGSVLGLITPFFISLGGWQIYCVIRIIQGLFQGLFFPCSSQHLANWAPPFEVTRLGALSYNGVSIGTVMAMLTSGLIAKSSWGWPGISYFAGGLGIIWCVIWQIFADNTPTTSRIISIEEKKFILKSQEKKDGVQKKIPIPWKAIFTSRPLLSLMVANIAAFWGYITVLLEMPLYIRGVLRMNISNNAIFSSIPYVAVFGMSFVYLLLLEILMKKNVFSLTTSKKIINTISMWIPAAAFIWVGFLDENQKELAILLLVIIVGVNAGVTVGIGMNTIELAPNHAAVLGAFNLTSKSGMATCTPLIIGMIVNNQTDRSQWQIVFLIAGVMFFLGNLQYLFFGTTDRQAWNAEDFLEAKHDTEKQTKSNPNLNDLKPELQELIEKPKLLKK